MGMIIGWGAMIGGVFLIFVCIMSMINERCQENERKKWEYVPPQCGGHSAQARIDHAQSMAYGEPVHIGAAPIVKAQPAEVVRLPAEVAADDGVIHLPAEVPSWDVTEIRLKGVKIKNGKVKIKSAKIKKGSMV